MHGFDNDEPPGTSLNPLGRNPGSQIGYLLGVACRCGRRSLVVADAYEGVDDLRCPGCGSSLR
ncbi:MAG TPA: hypothetical protein VGB18_02465 [Candidatus Thermoplasmatota archaeon]